MMRIALFLGTNLAVIVVIGIIMSVFLLGRSSDANSIDDYMSLFVMCFCYGMIGSMTSLFSSKSMAKRSMCVQLIENPSHPTEQWLVDTVRKQAEMVNIDMPEVGIFNNRQPNAFATGWNKNSALVAISTGLLETMSANEVEAVLAHEIGHVANGDMVTLSLLQGIVNTFVIFFARIITQLVHKLVFKNGNERGIVYFIACMVMNVVLGILASTIVMWFSRYREFKADEMGAKLAGKQNMIDALDALRPASQKPDRMPESLKTFAISSGQSIGFSLANLIRTHPTLDDRIEALKKL